MNKAERNVPLDEVLSTIPRQLSGHDWGTIYSKFPEAVQESMFTEDEANMAVYEAQRIALPGLFAIREVLRSIPVLMKANGVNEYDVNVRDTTPNNTILVARATNGMTVLGLYQTLPQSDELGRDVTYMLPHYEFDEKFAKHFSGQLRGKANMEMMNRESEKVVYYGLDELIVELPRSVKVGELLSYIGAERKFTAVRITEIVEHMKTVAGY